MNHCAPLNGYLAQGATKAWGQNRMGGGLGGGNGRAPRLRAQVPAKAQVLMKIVAQRIDGGRRWRYSQAQIPDLVAHANPRFRPPAQSSGSALSYALRIPVKLVDSTRRHEYASEDAGEGSIAFEAGKGQTAGAKALDPFGALAARLKSCPDTKPSSNGAGVSFSAARAGDSGRTGEFADRFAIDRPEAGDTGRNRIPSTHQRRIGGC